MATTTRICLRRGTSAEWQSINPILFLGEVGIDTTLGRMKMGDNRTAWNDLPFLYDETVEGVISALTMLAQLAGAVSGVNGELKAIVPTAGEISTVVTSPVTNDFVLVTSENKLYSYNGTAWEAVEMKASGDGMSKAEIEAAIDEKYNSFGFGGIGYTITAWNEYDKPTNVVYADGTTVVNTYRQNTILTRTIYTHPDGSTETVVYNYDARDRFQGTTVTKESA